MQTNVALIEWICPLTVKLEFISFEADPFQFTAKRKQARLFLSSEVRWNPIFDVYRVYTKVPVFNRFPNSFTHKKNNLIFHSKQYNSVSN